MTGQHRKGPLLGTGGEGSSGLFLGEECNE